MKTIQIALMTVAGFLIIGDGRVGAVESKNLIPLPIGNVNFDGTARIEFALTQDPIFSEILIPLTLTHMVRTDETGSSISEWKITGLETSLVSIGDRAFIWNNPAGAEVALNVGGEHNGGVRLERGQDDRLVVVADSGVKWIYKGGTIKMIVHPALGSFYINCEGDVIDSVERDVGGVRVSLVSVRRDKERRVKKITINGDHVFEFRWGTQSTLDRFSDLSGQWYLIDYKAGLLAAIGVPGQGVWNYRWEKTADWQKWHWPVAVHLAEDNDDLYSFKLSRLGATLTIENLREHWGVETIYDRASGKILQRRI